MKWRQAIYLKIKSEKMTLKIIQDLGKRIEAKTEKI